MSIDESADAGFAEIIIDSSFREGCGRLVVIDGGEGRQTLDVGDRWQGLMRDWKEAERDSTVDGREGNSLVRS